jgi:hypothetical protein
MKNYQTFLKSFLISIIIIKSVITQSQSADQCGSIIPNVNNDCLIASDSNYYCCYRTDDNQKSKSCTPILRSSYTPSQYFIDGNGYNLDCGANANNNSGNTKFTNKNNLALPMYTCGKTNPIIVSDCSDFSMVGNSCCYFKNGLRTGCYWLGQSFSGSANLTTYDITCSSGLIGMNMMLIFLVISLFFV